MKTQHSQKKKKKLHDIEFGSDFLDVTPKAQKTKEKREKVDFMKI